METPSDILLEAIDPIRTAPFEPGDLRRLEEIEAVTTLFSRELLSQKKQNRL